jgi:hypothetical protein
MVERFYPLPQAIIRANFGKPFGNTVSGIGQDPYRDLKNTLTGRKKYREESSYL